MHYYSGCNWAQLLGVGWDTKDPKVSKVCCCEALIAHLGYISGIVDINVSWHPS